MSTTMQIDVEIITCSNCGENRPRHRKNRLECRECLAKKKLANYNKNKGKRTKRFIQKNHSSNQKRAYYEDNRSKLLAKKQEQAPARALQRVENAPQGRDMITKEEATGKKFYRGFYYRKRYLSRRLAGHGTVYWHTVPGGIDVWPNHSGMATDAKAALTLFVHRSSNEFAMFNGEYASFSCSLSEIENVLDNVWSTWREDDVGLAQAS